MMKFVVDAGHGGTDPGALGHNLKEKDITLDLALRTGSALLLYQNVEVIYTRKTDVFISLDGRAEIANNAKADYFLSLHCNALDGQSFGFESYIHDSLNDTGTTAQKRAVIHDRMMKFLTLFGTKDHGKKKANFAVLRETNMPAVLLENLFIDHAYEAKLLGDSVFRAGLSSAITAGVADAFNLQPKPQPKPDPKKEAVDWLYAQGLLTDPKWKADIEKPLPIWAEAMVLKKFMEKIKG